MMEKQQVWSVNLLQSKGIVLRDDDNGFRKAGKMKLTENSHAGFEPTNAVEAFNSLNKKQPDPYG
jgi:hypothetical protein